MEQIRQDKFHFWDLTSLPSKAAEAILKRALHTGFDLDEKFFMFLNNYMNATDEKEEHLSIYDTRRCTSTHRQRKEGEWEAVWMRHRGDWKAEEHNLGFKLVISTTDHSSLQSCYLDVSRVDICSYLATADIKKRHQWMNFINCCEIDFTFTHLCWESEATIFFSHEK